jgi:hypothetical protein
VRTWLEWAVLALLAAFAVAPAVGLLLHAQGHGLVWSGADSSFPADEYQYLSWVRQYSDHLLAANLLDVAPSSHVFLHPMFLVSGIGVRLGLGAELAYLLWKPIALVVAFLGVRAYAARFLEGTWPRLLALLIGLFFLSPVSAVADWASLGSGLRRGELGAATIPSPAVLLWGYLPTVIAVGLMPVFLLAVERVVRDRPASLRLPLLAAACGAAVSWLHPWQGEVLLVTVAAAVALTAEARRSLTRLVLPVAGLLAPLAYYFVLSRADADWRFAQQANVIGGHPRAWALLVTFLPLAAAAAAGLRPRTPDLGERMLQLWPVAAVLVFVALSPSFAQHAFEGVAVPLGILAVRGVCRARHGLAWAVAFAALAVVPGSIHAGQFMADSASANAQPFFLQPGERDALAYLHDLSEPGAVLPTPFLSSLVPARTERKTWLGHPSWTRDYDRRAAEAAALFGGRLPPTAASEMIRRSGARFVLADCRSQATSMGALAPLASSVRRFGCASVYLVAAPGP